MNPEIKILDTVILTQAVPEDGLAKGQVGTVVTLFNPETVEVEFCSADGQTYTSAILSADQFEVLSYELLCVA